MIPGTIIPVVRRADFAVPHSGPDFVVRVTPDAGDPIVAAFDAESAVCLCDNLMRRLRDVYGLEAACLVLENLKADLGAEAARKRAALGGSAT